jgi:hypothetical protein
VIYVVRFGRANDPRDGRTVRCGGKLATQTFGLSAGDLPNKVLKEARRFIARSMVESG